MVSIAASIPDGVVRENVERLRAAMRKNDTAAVIVFHPSNMLALTGTPHAAWDRLTCAAVTRDGGVHLVCPTFERPGVRGAEPHATIHTWDEDQDAYAVLADALRSDGAAKGRIGVDGRVWLESWYAFCGALPDANLHNGEALLRAVRIRKSSVVVEIMRAAHRRGERVFLELQRIIRAGASEIELHRELQARFAGDGLTVNPMIQSGPNGAIPHNPTGDRELREGDNVVVDSVTVTDGFHNDLTRTFAIGKPTPRARQAYDAVRRAQAAAIEMMRPGARCGDVDTAARAIIEAACFGAFFTHRLGHGIGIEVHEPPYLNGANDELLEPGMCVTVEPGVYVPGEFGVRIEDDVVITDNGCEVLRGELQTDVSPAFST